MTASSASWTALSGPMISTVGGSVVVMPTTYPGAGSPSTAGAIGSCFTAVGSKTKTRVDGAICTTSMPNGVLTCSGVS